MKSTIKFDRLNWFKAPDDDLKSQPAKSWNYVGLSLFRKRNSTSVQIEANCEYLFEPGEVADAFATHLHSVYNNFITEFPTPASCLNICYR